MNVYLFGAVSSPSCSKFALRKQADDAEKMLEQGPQMFCERTLRLMTVCALKKKEIPLSKDYVMFSMFAPMEGLIWPNSSATPRPFLKV